ncbi:MAG: HNH endonuclease signature motif containing protein [Acidimicrobiia bacterium]
MHRVERLAGELCEALAELEPGALPVEVAGQVAERLANAENACAVAKVRLVARAAEGGVHRRRGFADTSDWVATVTGSTTTDARHALEVVDNIDACPETRDALVKGEVSLAQAGEIARTEAEVPGTEHELLELAKRGTLGAVRATAQKRRVEAVRAEELHAKQRKARTFRTWRDGLGMVCGSFALPPDVGVALLSRIDDEADRLVRDAKRGGEREAREAHAADAFVAVIDGRDRRGAGGIGATIVIDWPALARGHAHPGERCHIVGGGPIPVSVARRLMENAFVKALLTDGVEVQQVKHFGRRMSAELRTALELGPPPEFAGVTCAELECERRYGLEWDHIVPVAGGGETSLDNLGPKCKPHHWEKTKRDRANGWRGS